MYKGQCQNSILNISIVLPHTADVQIHSWGSTLGESFVHAAYALIDCMTQRASLLEDSTSTVELEIEGEDEGELLVNFLEEILFRFFTPPFLAIKRVEVLSYNATSIKVQW